MDKEDIEEMYGHKKKDYTVIEIIPVDPRGLIYDANSAFTQEVADENIRLIRECLAFSDPYKKRDSG